MKHKGHLNKYENNKKLIETLESHHPSFNDWVVTSAFYSALHLVDGTILEISDNNFKPKDHSTRRQYIAKMKEFKNIRNEYEALYILSRKSRYECVAIKDQDKNDSLEYLAKIEGELLDVD